VTVQKYARHLLTQVPSNASPAESIGAIVAHNEVSTVGTPTAVFVQTIAVLLVLAATVELAATLHNGERLR